MRGCRRLVVVMVAVLLTGCGNEPMPSGPGGPAATAPPGTGAVTTGPAPGSGTVTETRPVSGVTGVELESFGDLYVEQTGTESLTIEAEAGVLPQLTSDVSRGVLRLGVAPGTTVRTSRPVVYRLTVATLDAVAVTGAGDLAASNLRTGRLTVEVSGAGDATLTGAVDSQVVAVSGTGTYDGDGLQSATAEVTVTGTGDAIVRVSDRLDATVSGTGSVEYIGDPQVTTDISGVGSVEQR